ncbi:MAG: response regulator transcription factor [Candidatus Acidiferrum sp.]
MKSYGAIRVLVVDDHPVVLMGIATIINARSDIEVVAQARTGEEAILLYKRHSPDITLMDLRLPRMSGVEAIRAIRVIAPKARFVVLTTYEGDEDIHQALKSGAQGYLVKGMPHTDLIEAIKRVHRGEYFVPPPIADVLASCSSAARLTPREREVLSLLVDGKANKEIGTAMNVSETTIKSHVSVILMKLGACDRTQAVVIALQRGILHL